LSCMRAPSPDASERVDPSRWERRVVPTNRMQAKCSEANFQSTVYKQGICKYLRGFVAGPMA
jgi:hypothetical protein